MSLVDVEISSFRLWMYREKFREKRGRERESKEGKIRCEFFRVLEGSNKKKKKSGSNKSRKLRRNFSLRVKRGARAKFLEENWEIFLLRISCDTLRNHACSLNRFKKKFVIR